MLKLRLKRHLLRTAECYNDTWHFMSGQHARYKLEDLTSQASKRSHILHFYFRKHINKSLYKLSFNNRALQRFSKDSKKLAWLNTNNKFWCSQSVKGLLPSSAYSLFTFSKHGICIVGYFLASYLQLKAIFHYAIWSQTGPKLVADLLARARW